MSVHSNRKLCFRLQSPRPLRPLEIPTSLWYDASYATFVNEVVSRISVDSGPILDVVLAHREKNKKAFISTNFLNTHGLQHCLTYG